MTYTTALIMEWLSSILWPLARVSSLLMVMAVFGSRLAPAHIRIGLALAITLIIAPLLPPMPKIELFSLGSFLVLGQQLLIGIALGLMTQFLLETFVMAGQVIAMQTSLGFATLVFLAVDGHLLMLRMVVLSFETLPVSDSGLTLPAIRSLVSFLGVMYQASLVMALSAIIALLLINFAFGVMTRAAPQLNIFSIGFAVSMMSGLFILWLTIGGFMGHFDALWERVQETSCELINVQCFGGQHD
ncbi:flagellar biosynthetic protein FliR [Aeromonas caviae]|uniref:flagellar biosynthetic protein FliR n=1 Tax=Aeromonas caviae TaxID=648 RepID=UPI002B45E328|nr:flagellar biosynthetic protein FliR [Aeromonas caviae]